MAGIDDVFEDFWDDEFIRQFLGERKKLERNFMERIKKLQEAMKSGKIPGKAEIVPIDKPGITGFIFRGVFGTPEALEEEGKIPELADSEAGSKERFTVREGGKEELRKPVIEKFENGNEFVVLVELPGVAEQEIRIETGNTWIRVAAINFKTTKINVPSNADVSQMTKSYKNGVLEMRMSLRRDDRESKEVKFGIV